VVHAEPQRDGQEMNPPCYREALNYRVSCPGLPGCWSQGAAEEEALENIRSAIEEYLQARVRTAPLSLRLTSGDCDGTASR
jgi:hypothetical protein